MRTSIFIVNTPLQVNDLTDYKGFSSYSPTAPRDTRLVGLNLIKQDLLNHFNIEPGSVRGRPLFGCALKTRLGQPLDGITRTEIENDVRGVIDYDPRIELLALDIVPTAVTGGFAIGCKVKQTGTSLVDVFEFFVTADGVQ